MEDKVYKAKPREEKIVSNGALYKPDLREILGQLAGASSLCWVPKPTGVFDSTAASGFVDEAFARINAIYDERCNYASQIADLTVEMERLRAPVATRIETNDTLKNDNASLRARVAELEHERAQMSACIGQMEANDARLREALEYVVEKTWFDRRKEGKGACMWCDCGDAGYPTNDDGHDTTCPASRARAALGNAPGPREKK